MSAELEQRCLVAKQCQCHGGRQGGMGLGLLPQLERLFCPLVGGAGQTIKGGVTQAPVHGGKRRRAQHCQSVE